MRKLLLVEDEEILLKMYKDKFDSGGYEVITAIDGEGGLAEAIKHQPDFIILDLRLPKINGIAVLDKLKETPVLKDIPVAILTVVQKEIALKEDPNLMSKAVAYWRKDQITPTEVMTQVERILDSNG